MSIIIPAHIKSLKPYVAGKPIEELAREKGLSRIVKLASNENPVGSSPLALKAAQEALAHSYRYPDPSSFRLTGALSEKHGIPKNRLICGAGTDSLLANIIASFTTREDEILTSEGTFIGIYVNARKLNRRLRMVPLSDYRFDLSAILGAISERTKLIYIANPNNPTGTHVSRSEWESFIAAVPPEILIILDEAYYNYAADSEGYPDGLSYDYHNLIVTRTFSKDYGLAGFRVGFAVGPENLIHEMYKVRLPFEPSYPAQIAAVASLGDSNFLKQTLDLNRKTMTAMKNTLTKTGIQFAGGEANFLLMLFPDEQFAASLHAECLNRGLILRHCNHFGIPNAIRINSGTLEETKFALECITDLYETIARDRQTNGVANSPRG